jgi:hypothetical protein
MIFTSIELDLVYEMAREFLCSLSIKSEKQIVLSSGKKSFKLTKIGNSLVANVNGEMKSLENIVGLKEELKKWEF